MGFNNDKFLEIDCWSSQFTLILILRNRTSTATWAFTRSLFNIGLKSGRKLGNWEVVGMVLG